MADFHVTCDNIYNSGMVADVCGALASGLGMRMITTLRLFSETLSQNISLQNIIKENQKFAEQRRNIITWNFFF